MSRYSSLLFNQLAYISVEDALLKILKHMFEYNENTYTYDVIENFIYCNMRGDTIPDLLNLSFEMHIIIAKTAIMHHTLMWPISPSENNARTNALTVDSCKEDLKKIYMMYYNVCRKRLYPKGQVFNASDPMKNFKNRMKIVRANMFHNTKLDGNTYGRHKDIIIP